MALEFIPVAGRCNTGRGVVTKPELSRSCVQEQPSPEARSAITLTCSQELSPVSFCRGYQSRAELGCRLLGYIVIYGQNPSTSVIVITTGDVPSLSLPRAFSGLSVWEGHNKSTGRSRQICDCIVGRKSAHFGRSESDRTPQSDLPKPPLGRLEWPRQHLLDRGK